MASVITVRGTLIRNQRVTYRVTRCLDTARGGECLRASELGLDLVELLLCDRGDIAARGPTV